MRIQVTLDDELVAELDRRAGSQGRSAFVAELIARGLQDERRWNEINLPWAACPILGTSGTMIPGSGCDGSDTGTPGGPVDDGSTVPEFVVFQSE